MRHELNDAGGAKELAKYRLNAAKEDLAAAKNSFEQGFYRTANNRAYYAIFPKEISRKISRAQEVRHASDYDDFYIVRAEEVKEQIAAAEEVVAMVENYLLENTEKK